MTEDEKMSRAIDLVRFQFQEMVPALVDIASTWVRPTLALPIVATELVRAATQVLAFPGLGSPRLAAERLLTEALETALKGQTYADDKARPV